MEGTAGELLPIKFQEHLQVHKYPNIFTNNLATSIGNQCR